jgi:hypothetical protein
VVGIERLDVGRSFGYPVGDDIGFAARAARLITQLPREDGRGSLVARDNGLNVSLIHALHLLIRVPIRLAASIGSNVGVHATIIIPEVYKGNDKLDAVLLSSRNNIIKALQTISASVDGSFTRGFVVELEVDFSILRDGVNVIETPNSEDFETRFFQILEDRVNIGIVGLEWQPIRVCASKVLGFAVNIELESVDLGKRAAASGLRSAQRGGRSHRHCR